MRSVTEKFESGPPTLARQRLAAVLLRPAIRSIGAEGAPKRSPTFHASRPVAVAGRRVRRRNATGSLASPMEGSFGACWRARRYWVGLSAFECILQFFQLYQLPVIASLQSIEDDQSHIAYKKHSKC